MEHGRSREIVKENPYESVASVASVEPGHRFPEQMAVVCQALGLVCSLIAGLLGLAFLHAWSTPYLNDSSGLPVEVNFVPIALGFALAAGSLFVSMRRWRESAPGKGWWLIVLAAAFITAGVWFPGIR